MVSEKDLVHELEHLPTSQLRRIARGEGKRASVARTILRWEEQGRKKRRSGGLLGLMEDF